MNQDWMARINQVNWRHQINQFHFNQTFIPSVWFKLRIEFICLMPDEGNISRDEIEDKAANTKRKIIVAGANNWAGNKALEWPKQQIRQLNSMNENELSECGSNGGCQKLINH